MPKCYSPQERDYIRKRLKEEAASCLMQYGVRKTTVDELVQRVNIPKGTFYLFYKTKELLLFEVILEQHDQMERTMMQEISRLDPKHMDCEALTTMLFQFYKMAEKLPILLNPREVELLARKLPAEILAQHMGHDTDMIEQLLKRFPLKNHNPQTLSAAFRAIYMATLHEKEIGSEHYDEALKLLIRGLVLQILP